MPCIGLACSYAARLKSAQNPVTPLVMGEAMGYGQAQIVSQLQLRADVAAVAITARRAAWESPGVLHVGFGS